MVEGLDRQLKTLLEELPQSAQIGTLTKPSEESVCVSRRTHALYLHFSIHGSLLALHSHFFYPWLSSKFWSQDSGGGDPALLEAQIASSSRTVAEAARQILLALRTVTTNVATPTWLALSYPIYAHLSLFIYVLMNPTLPTATADLGLLDICAGHFGYIDFVTSSGISISLPRESVNLAAKVVKAARRYQEKIQLAHPEQLPYPLEGAAIPNRLSEEHSLNMKTQLRSPSATTVSHVSFA